MHAKLDRNTTILETHSNNHNNNNNDKANDKTKTNDKTKVLKNGWTTIRCRENTKETIDRMRDLGETFDDVLNYLLDRNNTLDKVQT